MEDEVDVKVVIVGATEVGKTSILNVLTNGDMGNEISPTIGASFLIKDLEVNHSTIHLALWDTAGQEKYKSMTPLYFRGALYGIIVFSIIDLNSFLAVDSWVKSVKQHSGENTVFLLVGNKVDLEQSREVTKEQALSKARQMNAEYFEVSAVTKKGITELFNLVATKEYEKQSVPSSKNDEQNQPKRVEKKKSSGCC